MPRRMAESDDRAALQHFPGRRSAAGAPGADGAGLHRHPQGPAGNNRQGQQTLALWRPDSTVTETTVPDSTVTDSRVSDSRDSDYRVSDSRSGQWRG